MSMLINISELEIKELLKKTLKPEYAETMSQCILANIMENESLVRIFIKVAMGIPIVCNYKVEDYVLCDYHALNDWQFDTAKMIHNKMIDAKNNILVRIIDVSLYKVCPYKVKHSFINKSNGKTETSTIWIHEDQIIGYPILIGDTV